MIGAVSRAVRAPVQLLHELAHAAAAAPWAERWRVVIGPYDGVGMQTQVEFRDDAPAWAIASVYLAPLLTGLLGAFVAGLLLAIGRVDAPATGWDLLVWSALAMAWVLYTWPSQRDRAGARAALGGDDDG